MAFQTKSSVLAIIKEVTEGTLVQPSAGSQFTVLREGFTVQGALETVSSDELVNDIGASKSFSSKETPTASIPKYFKHSGIEGQAPDYGLLIESAMGSVTVNATEYDTDSGSIAGDRDNRAYLQMPAGEAANFEVGQALLIKHGSANFEIRNIQSIDTGADRLFLNFNLDTAPALATNLGKAIFYQAQATGHPTYSVHHFQASDSSSGFHQALAGCRTTSMAIAFPVNELATIDFDIEGIKYYFDPMTVTASNKYVDFTDDGGTKSIALTEGTYDHPSELAAALAERLSLASVNTISVYYDASKFTFGSDGTTFELNWATGTNTANSAATLLGFDGGSDDTGSTTYTSDNAQTWGPSVAPEYDDQTPTIVKSNEFFFGDYFNKVCRSGSNVSLTVSTPKTDVDDYCAVSGVSESIVLERTAELTATLTFKKDEIDGFYNLLKNRDVALAFNHGPKSGGNWEAGKCVNVYMAKATITANTIADTDGLVIVEMTASGFVTSAEKDIHISFI